MGIDYATPKFYLEEIEQAVSFFCSDDIQGLGTSVFSFFSGSKYKNGQQVTVDSQHFEIILKSSELSNWFQKNPRMALKWIEAIFFYFRAMSAIPEIARSIWPLAARIVEEFRVFEMEALLASFQLASWDYFYGRECHPGYLEHIKSLPLKNGKARAYRRLFNTTAINREQADYIENIVFAYKERSSFGGANFATALINYYCHIEDNENILSELKACLANPPMSRSIEIGNCDFLKPLIGFFYDNNDYKSLLNLLRNLKGLDDGFVFSSSHGFLLSNGEALVVISPSGRDEFKNKNNYESYKSLIRVVNKSTNTATSLLGEFGENTGYFDEIRRGAPPIDDDLEHLAEVTIEHFNLKNSIYSEFNSITLTPSHGFPVQSALFLLGKNAPLISTSLEEVVDDPEVKRFIFFLSSHTSTCNIERDFILREFGPEVEIIIDPGLDLFLDKLGSKKYNVIYVSAHGQYDHWDTGVADEIFFSETSRITTKELRGCIPDAGFKRNVILNICNGASTEISCNPYSRGIAASMAKGNQTVISHLWPVSPVYACAFGMLVLYAMKTRPAIESSRFSFEVLNNENSSIITNALRISPSFEVLKKYLERKDFKMRDFKNIGSIAVYS